MSCCFIHNSIHVYSFPTGAGSCIGGEPAVGFFHTQTRPGRTVKSETLSQEHVNVTIGGLTLTPGKVSNLTSKTFYNITVSSPSGMQGILIRVQPPAGVKTSAILTPGYNMHLAPVCIAPVVGITHNSSDITKIYKGTINFPLAMTGVLMDITIVFSATLLYSEYAYGNFTINFNSFAPVPMPVSKPISKPVPKPVAAPVAKPVVKPFAQPVVKPVAKPVSKPVAKPKRKRHRKPINKP